MLFNIILAAIVIVPMAYFFMSGSSSEKKLKSTFLSKINEKGYQVVDVEIWQKGVIGLNSKNNMLYYQGFLQGDNDLYAIDLSEVKSCTLEKTFSSESVHNSATNVLHKATLTLKLSNSNVHIKMYDADETIQMQDDVLKAIKWEKIINAIVLNLKK
ncbi:MAG TPA: hypothetical protein PJ990_20940 [Saprospiraceae bacterium]|nr:hypothetical protein [Saprospiraceae bacterium]